MKLSRRSFFTAVPAATLVPAISRASETPKNLSLSHVRGMFEHRPVSNVQDRVFEKTPEIPVAVVSDEGRNICIIQKPAEVIVPLDAWPDIQTSTNPYREVLDRLEACLDSLIWNMTPTRTRDFQSVIGDADRVCRRPSPSWEKEGPELYVFSKGPIGYHLVQVVNNDMNQDRHGVVVFANRLRVVVIDGMPLGA